MGTRLSAAVVKAPASSQPLQNVAGLLGAIADSGRFRNDVVIHLSIARAGPHRLVWCQAGEHLPGQPDPDDIALILSRSFATSLSVFQSDSLGEAGYAVFERGSEAFRNDFPIPGHEPLYPRIAEGFERAFPGCGLGSGEDALDLFYGPEAAIASFLVVRSGIALPVPEPFLAPAPVPRRKSLLDREFSWGYAPRRFLRGCALAFGFLGAGLVLVAVGWLLLELWKAR